MKEKSITQRRKAPRTQRNRKIAVFEKLLFASLALRVFARKILVLKIRS
jgi:hypothetical protein